jgi:endonuclease NucS-like protein
LGFDNRAVRSRQGRAASEDIQLGADVLRPTLRELEEKTFQVLADAMRQPDRWVGLLSHFAYEHSLSDYIAAYPHRLEDGLRPYPSRGVREKVFTDGSRSDVLLIDRAEVPVVVECKQGTPMPDHVRQLTGYLKKLRAEAPKQPKPRGILVHGGARKLPKEVQVEIENSDFNIDVLQYELNVGFSVCH